MAIFVLLFCGANGFAEELRPSELILENPCEGVKAAYITHSRPPEEPVAVVVLINLYNRKTRAVLNDEERIAFTQMVNEVNSNGLALAYVEINEDGTLLKSMQGKDYKAKKGASGLIVQQVRKLFGDQIPLCLYPRYNNTFPIFSEIAEEFSREIGAWGIYNLLPPESFAKRLSCPGIVACGNDHVDLEKFENSFKEGRGKGRKWIWLEVKPSTDKEFKSLFWKYFAAAPKMEEHWFAISTGLDAGGDSSNLKNPDLVYSPSAAVGKDWADLQSKRTDVPTVVEKIIEPKTEGLSPLAFYLRLPAGAKDGKSLSGIIAYCTWEQDRKRLMQQLLYDPDRPEKELRIPAVQMLKYASEHNLGVLTWSTPGKWSSSKSSDELARRDLKQVDELFDDYSAMWDKAVTEYVKELGIPDSDYLLYGMSRGAQWAHRLALRKPERFWAINIHVNSSYDIPTPAGSQCLWLVTTGDLEHGYLAAKRFYRQSLDLGYPIIFKAEEKLGHSSCPEVEKLRDHFFDFALDLLKEKNAKNLPKAEMSKLVAERLKQGPFVGDFLNQQVFAAAESDMIDSSLRVYLPNKEIAEAWRAKYTPKKVE